MFKILILLSYFSPTLLAKENSQKQEEPQAQYATVAMWENSLFSILPSKQIELGKIMLQHNLRDHALHIHNNQNFDNDMIIKIKYKDIFEANIPISDQTIFDENMLYSILMQFFSIVYPYQQNRNKSILNILNTDISSFEITIYKSNFELLVKTYLINQVQVPSKEGVKEIDLFYTPEGSTAYSLSKENRQEILQKIAHQLLQELQKNIEIITKKKKEA